MLRKERVEREGVAQLGQIKGLTPLQPSLPHSCLEARTSLGIVHCTSTPPSPDSTLGSQGKRFAYGACPSGRHKADQGCDCVPPHHSGSTGSLFFLAQHLLPSQQMVQKMCNQALNSA